METEAPDTLSTRLNCPRVGAVAPFSHGLAALRQISDGGRISRWWPRPTAWPLRRGHHAAGPDRARSAGATAGRRTEIMAHVVPRESPATPVLPPGSPEEREAFRRLQARLAGMFRELFPDPGAAR